MALLVWLIILILLIKYLYSTKFVSISSKAITKFIFIIVALIYVNDTDIVLLNKGNKIEIKIIARAQLLLDLWHTVLSFTGGNLKVSKYFWII